MKSTPTYIPISVVGEVDEIGRTPEESYRQSGGPSPVLYPSGWRRNALCRVPKSAVESLAKAPLSTRSLHLEDSCYFLWQLRFRLLSPAGGVSIVLGQVG